MAIETKGYLYRVTFSQDGTLVVHAKSKKQFGKQLADKIDTTTDLTTVNQAFEPGFLPEILPGSIEVSHDLDEEVKFLAILGQKGTITFTSTASGKHVDYADAWVDSYDAQDAGLNDQPTATIALESGGDAAGEPAVAANP